MTVDIGQKDNFIKVVWSSVNKAIDLMKISAIQTSTILQLSSHYFQIISYDNIKYLRKDKM